MESEPLALVYEIIISLFQRNYRLCDIPFFNFHYMQ